MLTHRGLEPNRPGFFSESSHESFQNHLLRGFGIEFDPNFIKDDRIVITHDGTLTRITNGNDTRLFKDITPDEVLKINLGNGRLCFFEELMDLISASKSKMSAMHLKGGFQEKPHITILFNHLRRHASGLIDRFLIFDVKPEVAHVMKTEIPDLHLAPSVAHPHDITRYNEAVKGTLLSIEEAIKYRQEGLYDWVWLDEWDLTDREGGAKKLYTKETFDKLRSVGYKIALVTPELHGTSPGLLGGEAHPDAKPQQKLFERIKEIISLSPDAICTDYPEEAAQL